MISLADALNKMKEKDRKGVPLAFDIVFSKGSTGEVVEMQGVVKCNPGHNEKEHRTIGIKHVQSRNVRAIKVRGGIMKFNGEDVFW
jgi:hypothetical protein